MKKSIEEMVWKAKKGEHNIYVNWRTSNFTSDLDLTMWIEKLQTEDCGLSIKFDF